MELVAARACPSGTKVVSTWPLKYARYIDKELEEGKPNSRYIDNPEIPGISPWLAWLASTVASIPGKMLAERQPP